MLKVLFSLSLTFSIKKEGSGYVKKITDAGGPKIYRSYGSGTLLFVCIYTCHMLAVFRIQSESGSERLTEYFRP
jgi:hypothetical protein